MKNLSKVKIIISYQIIRIIEAHVMKIDLSAFVRNLVIKKNL